MLSGEFEESVKLYKEALALAQAAGDTEAVEQFEKGLNELSRRKEEQKQSTNKEPSAEQ